MHRECQVNRSTCKPIPFIIFYIANPLPLRVLALPLNPLQSRKMRLKGLCISPSPPVGEGRGEGETLGCSNRTPARYNPFTA